MEIKINGEIKTFENATTELRLEALLTSLGYKPQLVVVELNGEIINPDLWMGTLINNGDSLEVVTIVGGGSYS
tara:strand:- start:291 stop:509 length:219 start_codon:yes stop_codon:yes gene_type:complete